eukprot:6637183-Pyramimonas_sp.AAC.1
MSKFYEHTSLESLEDRCRARGFPLVIARVCLYAYRCGRFMCLGGCVDGPYFARKGVVAGCSMATTFVRVFCMNGYDRIPPIPRLGLD